WMAVAGLAAFAAVAVWVERVDEPAAAPSTPGSVALGRQVFATAGCAGCHTLADARATGTVGPDLDAAEPSAALVSDRVTNGLGVMPSFAGKLSTAQIAAVAAYVSSTAGKEDRPDAPDPRGGLRVLGPPRGRRRPGHRRGIPTAAPARVTHHPRPLVRRGGMDPLRRPRP